MSCVSRCPRYLRFFFTHQLLSQPRAETRSCVPFSLSPWVRLAVAARARAPLSRAVPRPARAGGRRAAGVAALRHTERDLLWMLCGNHSNLTTCDTIST